MYTWSKAMETTAQYALIVIGMAAILGAILGGPVKIFSVVLPAPRDVKVRAMLGGAGVLAVVLGLFVVPIAQVSDCNPRLDIVAPEGETEVRRDGAVAALVVTGTSQNIVGCGDESVAVAVHPLKPAADGFWMSEAVPVSPDGLWRTTVFLGSDASPVVDGQRFELVAVATDIDPRSVSSPVLDLDVLSPAVQSPAVDVVVRLAAEVSIGFPKALDVVRAQSTDEVGVVSVTVRGEVSGFGDRDQVVVLVRAKKPASPGWWPASPVDPDGDGRWSVPVFLGSAGSPIADAHLFTVRAVITDRDLGVIHGPLANVSQLDPSATSREVTFEIEIDPKTAVLAVAKSGTGSGTVADESGAIDCGNVCRHEFELGTAVTLSAVASDGSAFAGWDAPGCFGTGDCEIVVDAATTVVATFEPVGVTFDLHEPLIEITVEGEDGHGMEAVHHRENASGGSTAWLRLSTQTLTMEFEAPARATYTISVLYSNDNDGPLEKIDVNFDGERVGSFVAEDSGDRGFGSDWDVFVSSGPMGTVDAASGSHVVTLSFTGGDGYGVEIDVVTLD